MLREPRILRYLKSIRLRQRTRLLLIVIACLLISYTVSLGQLKNDIEKLGRAETDHLGSALSEPIALVLESLILSRDSSSMNVLVAQLVQHERISGAQVLDPRGNVLARSGETKRTPNYRSRIGSEAEPLGELVLSLHPVPTEQLVKQVFMPTGLWGMAGAALTIIVLFVFGLRMQKPLDAMTDTLSNILLRKPAVPLDTERGDEWGVLNKLFNRLHGRVLSESVTRTEQIQEPEDAIDEIEEIDEFQDITDLIPTLNEELEVATPSGSSAMDELVGSKAESDPSSDRILAETISEEPHSESPRAAEPADDQPTTAAAASLSHAGAAPLTASKERGYLVYVDFHSASTHAVEAGQREDLIKEYLRFLREVARIYSGALDSDAADNGYLLFESGDSHQLQAIHALCAAQLFCRLYRSHNHNRVQAFAPVLNVRIALVGMLGSNLTDALDEASALTRATESNAIIVSPTVFQRRYHHHSVMKTGQYSTYTPELDEMPEKGEPTVCFLVDGLSADFQELIDQQAAHLLKKL